MRDFATCLNTSFKQFTTGRWIAKGQVPEEELDSGRGAGERKAGVEPIGDARGKTARVPPAAFFSVRKKGGRFAALEGMKDSGYLSRAN
jgi:hypothetical protein